MWNDCFDNIDVVSDFMKVDILDSSGIEFRVIRKLND